MKGAQQILLDTRYVPFTQQPYCCVPACLQMILYKNKLPLMAQEEIGSELGLVVPTDIKDLFYNVESRDKPVVSSGFGTRIQESNYSLDNLVQQRNWPFRYIAVYASKIHEPQTLINKLTMIESNNTDSLVCFQNDHGTGHVCVFDRINHDTVRLIDPSPAAPKWCSMPVTELFDRIRAHGDHNGGGLWIFNHL